MTKPCNEVVQYLANDLTTLIRRINEPYRSNLADWLRQQTGFDVNNLKGSLTMWFSLYSEQRMLYHYQAIHLLVHEAARAFGTRPRLVYDFHR